MGLGAAGPSGVEWLTRLELCTLPGGAGEGVSWSATQRRRRFREGQAPLMCDVHADSRGGNCQMAGEDNPQLCDERARSTLFDTVRARLESRTLKSGLCVKRGLAPAPGANFPEAGTSQFDTPAPEH